jgi:WD40 repeat protein
MKTDPKKVHVAKEFKCAGPLINGRFDPSGRYFFATSEDRTITRIDLETDQRGIYSGHESWVAGLAFAKDGKTIVSSGFDDTLIWWPMAGEKPKPIRTVKAHKGWIRTIATSPDGRFLASAGNDRVVKLWNMADGTPVREFKGHERDVYSMLFHPDGKFLLTGDLLGKVNQWEIDSGKLVETFDAKDLHSFNKGQDVDYGGVRSLHLNADQSQLICGGLHKGTNPLGSINEPLILRFDWKTRKLVKKHEGTGIRGVVWGARFHPEKYVVACTGGSAGGYLLFWKPDEEKPFHKFKLKDTAREMDIHPDGVQLATVHHDRKVRISRLVAKK